jgi:hypothetical protein
VIADEVERIAAQLARKGSGRSWRPGWRWLRSWRLRWTTRRRQVCVGGDVAGDNTARKRGRVARRRGGSIGWGVDERLFWFVASEWPETDVWEAFEAWSSGGKITRAVACFHELQL